MVNHPNRKRRVVASAPAHDHESDYASLLDVLQATFARSPRDAVFATKAAGLVEAYLGNLGDERQVHTCSACRRFIENFGGLVSIGDDGHISSAFWDEDAVPEFYRPAAAALRKKVESARVAGVFLSSDTIWGLPETGTWTHFAVASPYIYKRRLLTAGQAMAAKREDFKTVARALADFSPKVIAEAVRLLEAGHLARSDQFIVPLQWLADLHAKRSAAKDARVRDNLLWRAVALAPDGYCHPRASMTGTLLEDIASGMAFDEVKSRFDAKMHPLRYQRPQAAPNAGNIAEAEKIVEKLGIARSLERRFARLDELQTAWLPIAAKAPAAPSGGIFAHLDPKGPGSIQTIDAPAVTMTWEKFARTVLPGAEAIDAHIGNHRMGFIALTTAVHADAPPVLKWDREGARNPVAWYVYHNGSPASQWKLSPGWVKVTAIAPLPPMWGEKPLANLGEGFVLVLEGCADQAQGVGNALFPESLLGELHGVRSTIEAYSRRAEMQGREEASACGLDVRKGATSIGYRLRVTTAGMKTDYQLDRWD